jgi:hypothetical protein
MMSSGKHSSTRLKKMCELLIPPEIVDVQLNMGKCAHCSDRVQTMGKPQFAAVIALWARTLERQLIKLLR